jgi:hypothetical protein
MSTGKRLTTLRVKVPVLDTRCASALSAVERIRGYKLTHAYDLMYVAYCWNRFFTGNNVKRAFPKDYVFYLEGTPIKRRG